MKRGLIVVLGVVLIAFSVIGTTALANQKKADKQYSLKVIYDNKYIVDEMLDENSNVTIKYDKDVLHQFNLEKNEKMTLDKLKIPNDKVISYWKIEDTEDGYIISPEIVKKNEVSVDFVTTNGGKLFDKETFPSMTKTVEKGTKLSEILPEIKNKENFTFAGWFTLEDVENEVEIKEEDREDIKELKSQLEEKEKSLSKEKKKDKKKDLESEIKDIKKKLEEKKSEKQYEKEIITEYQPVRDIKNIELNTDKEYIAVSYPDINNNNKDDRKEKINLFVDFGLDNEKVEQEIHVGQPIKLSQPQHKDYIFIDWFLDSGFTERYTDETTFKEDTTVYAQWKTPQEIANESENNLIVEKRISDRVERYLNEKNQEIYKEQKEKLEKKKKELKAKYEDENANHTEPHYTLKNFKTSQTYLIKFYNGEEFLYSVSLPYGRTIELLNGNGQKVKEFAVRQESSIDISDLINNSNVLNFDVKTIKKNHAVITQIYPKNNKEMD